MKYLIIIFLSLSVYAQTDDLKFVFESGMKKAEKIKNFNEACSTCELKKQTEFAGQSAKPATAMEIEDLRNAATLEEIGRLRKPKADKNPFGRRFKLCQGLSNVQLAICKPDGEKDSVRFEFKNGGPNKIVKKSGNSIGRLWQFNYEAEARQDLSFEVTDFPDKTSSATQKSYLMVFPRTQLPQVETKGSEQIVTLPNGEKITFNAKTKEIIGGVFTEKAVLKGQSPAVTYTGKSVLIRANARDKLPQLLGNATITKGAQKCEVPKKDLWPDQTGNTNTHFAFPTDEAFDNYLQKKCGFGI